MATPSLLRRLRRDRGGIAMIEFALIAPLFLAMTMGTIELGYYVLANNRVQRLASMAADLVAQSGTGTTGATEGQIYDLFSALDLTAQPFDLRNHGRIVITGVKGTDPDGDKKVENTILWQRFDGADVGSSPMVGCAQVVKVATLPNGRVLPLDEMLFHVQVSYEYQPIFSKTPMDMFQLPTRFSRTTMFRARSKDFLAPTPDPKFPPKEKCGSATGL